MGALRKSVLNAFCSNAMPYIEQVTHSPEQTRRIGCWLGELTEPGDLILLVGNLGAGKTCFTQGIAKGLGFEGYASSPSFVLMREYQGRLPVYHFDLYRLDNIEEIADLGIDDYLYGDGICVVEWADKAGDYFPEDHLLIEFEYLPAANQRCLRFKPCGVRYTALLAQLEEKWN